MPALTSLLLDTHVWYRWRAEPRKLSRDQVRSLNKSERRGETVGISAISLWELAMLVARGRIRASMSPEIWLEEMAGSALIETIPITPRIASQSAQLGSGPADPADRIIVATAISLNLTLLASDQRIREWGGVRTI